MPWIVERLGRWWGPGVSKKRLGLFGTVAMVVMDEIKAEEWIFKRVSCSADIDEYI
jgi:hypothetical protein